MSELFTELPIGKFFEKMVEKEKKIPDRKDANQRHKRQELSPPGSIRINL